MDYKAELLKNLKTQGWTYREISYFWPGNLSKRTYLRLTSGVKRGSRDKKVPNWGDFGYIYGRTFFPDLPSGLLEYEGGCSEKQKADLMEDEAMGAQDDPISNMTDHIFYPDSSRKSGLLRYLKTEKDENRKMEDIPEFKTEKCAECGWSTPVEDMVNGLCEECWSEFRYHVHDSGVQKMPKKRKFDDEKDG